MSAIERFHCIFTDICVNSEDWECSVCPERWQQYNIYCVEGGGGGRHLGRGMGRSEKVAAG